MAVARVGTTVGPYWSGNSGSLSWPAGSAVGHLAVLHAYGTPSSKRQVDGWSSYKHTPSSDHWWKVLTASDIASALPIVKGYAATVSVYSGAGRIGAVSDLASQSPGVTTTVPGSMVDISGRGRKALTPSGVVGADQVLAAYDGRHCNVWALGPEAIPGWVGLTGFNGTDSTSVEVVPTAGPSAPTITAPSAGATVSAAAALVLSWIHRSAQTGTQNGYSVRLVKDGSTYYLTSGGTLTASVTTIASSSATATVAAGQLVSGSSYAISIQTSEGGVWSAWSSVTVGAITPPSVSSVTVSSPAGSLTPVVSWTGSTTGGQQAYQVRILPATAASADDVSVLWDSQATAGSDSSASAPPLATWVNGQSLKAWVRIQQPGLWSAWVASSAFSVSWTPPDAPSSVAAANQLSGPLLVTVAGVVAGNANSWAVAPSAEADWWLADTHHAWVVTQQSTDVARTGTRSFKAARVQDYTGVAALVRASGYLQVPAGVWSAWAWVRGTVGKVDFGVIATPEWADSAGSGTLLGSVTVTPSSGAWTRVGLVFTLAAAQTIRFWLGDDSSPAKASGQVLYVDDIGIGAAFPSGVEVDSSPDGVEWSPVKSLPYTAATVAIPVCEAPFGVPRWYRARQSVPVQGVDLWSTWTVTPAAVASTDMAGYLVGDDGSYRAVRIRTDEPPEREEPFTDFYGLSAITARVDSGPPQGWSGATTILTETLAEREDLIAWLDAHPVWVWRWPPERHGAAYADAGSIRATRHASFKPSRLAQAAISARDIPVGWVEQ